MKTIIIIFTSLCTFIAGIAHGQCDLEVVTDPSNPSNSSLPDGNSQFENYFDWNLPNFQETQLTNMQYNQNMLHIMNPQAPSYLNYIYYGEDPNPENGWELMLLNTGTFPNLDNLPNGTHPDVPYIILYNRYSGLLRIFANYGDGYLPSGISIDAVKVILKFDHPEFINGIYRLSENYDKAIDQPTSAKETVSLAKHPNSPKDWFVGEFQMAYDPCICYYPSNLRLDFGFIESEDLELHGRAISYEDDLIDNGVVTPKDYLSSFDYTGNSANGGVLIYRTLEGMITDYETKMNDYKLKLDAVNEYNAEVKRNLVVMKLLKQVVIQGGNATTTALTGFPWFGDAINFANDLIGDTAIKRKDIIKAAEKILGKEFDKYVAKNFVQQTPPTKPITPVATFTEMHFKGTLTNETTIDGPNFYTPGSYGTDGTGSPSVVGNELQYPIYNEPTGSFALLRTPKIRVSKKIKELIQYTGQRPQPDYSWSDLPTQMGVQTYYSYESWSKEYQFQLESDLSYLFNNSLDIKKKEIQVALVVKPKLKNENEVDYQVVNSEIIRATNVYHDPFYTTNLSTIKLNEPNLGVVTQTGNFGTSANFIYQPYSQGLFPQLATVKHPQRDTLIFTSPFIPIEVFKPTVFSIGQKNQLLRSENRPDRTKTYYYGAEIASSNIPFVPLNFLHSIKNEKLEYNFTVELKIMIDIEYHTLNSEGSTNKVSQLYTYQIPNENLIWESNELYPDLQNSIISGVSSFSDNLNFNNVTFDGTQKNGCVLIGNTYTCHAWNDINLTGNIIANTGYNVDFVARNQIIESPNSYIEGEIVRRIDKIIDYPMNEFDTDNLKDFCKGANGQAPIYQANIPTKSKGEIIEGTGQLQEHKKITNLEVAIYPNPTDNKTALVLSRPVHGVSIKIFDLTGRAVEIKILDEGMSFELDVSSLQSGLYVVKVSSPEGTITKNLIVK